MGEYGFKLYSILNPSLAVFGNVYDCWVDGEYVGRCTYEDTKEIGPAFINLAVDEKGVLVHDVTIPSRIEQPSQCKCVNVEIGSYSNQTILDYPFWFMSAKSNRSCGVDNCILEEILDLWERGIQTTESCCGHNKTLGYISVIDHDIPRMVSLGYENTGLRKDIFRPKSV